MYYCSVDGNGYSLSSEVTERWRKWKKYFEPDYQMANYRSLSCAGTIIFDIGYAVFLTLFTVLISLLYRSRIYYVLVTKHHYHGSRFCICNVVRRENYGQRYW